MFLNDIWHGTVWSSKYSYKLFIKRLDSRWDRKHWKWGHNFRYYRNQFGSPWRYRKAIKAAQEKLF